MRWPSAAVRCAALGPALVLGTLALPIGPAAAAEPGRPLAQYYGFTWVGWPAWFAGPPHAGSVAYPYYRYGPYYASALGAPYPLFPSGGTHAAEPWGPPYPLYPSAGGVALGGDYAAGGWAPLGRCTYSALAGIGGSWYDPPSLGYYAPFC